MDSLLTANKKDSRHVVVFGVYSEGPLSDICGREEMMYPFKMKMQIQKGYVIKSSTTWWTTEERHGHER